MSASFGDNQNQFQFIINNPNNNSYNSNNNNDNDLNIRKSIENTNRNFMRNLSNNSSRDFSNKTFNHNNNFNNQNNNKFNKSNEKKNLFLDYSDNNIFKQNENNDETEKVFHISNLSYANNTSKYIPNSKKTTTSNFHIENDNKGNKEHKENKEPKEFKETQKNKSVDKSNLLFYSSSQDFENDNNNKINNSININKQILNETINNNNNNNLNNTINKSYNLLNTIEKDRIIFEFTKKIKDEKTEKEEIKSAFEKREEIITKLIEDNKILNSNLKNMQKLSQAKEEEMEKNKNYFQEKIFNIEKEKGFFESKYNEILKIIEKQNSEISNLNTKNKKLESEISSMKKTIKEKTEFLNKTEIKYEEIKKENMTIPSLKKIILELEQNNLNLLEEIKTEKNINRKFLKEDLFNISNYNNNSNNIYIKQEKNLDLNSFEEKKDYNNYNNNNENEHKNNLEILSNNTKINYENENLKKEFEEKRKECEAITEKYKLIFSENENFVKYITNEVLNLNNFFEQFPKFNLKKKAFIDSKVNYFDIPNNEFKVLSLQFDILKKNFDFIKKNYENNYKENFEVFIKTEKANCESEAKIKNLQTEKDSIFIEYNIALQKLKQISENSHKLIKENKHLMEIISEIQSKNLKLNSENEELKFSNEEWKRLKNNLMYSITEKLNFLHSNFNLFFCFEKQNKNIPNNNNNKIHKNNEYENDIDFISNNEEIEISLINNSPLKNNLNINKINHNENGDLSNSKEGNLNEDKNNQKDEIVISNSLNLEKSFEEKKSEYVEKLLNFVDWVIIEYSKVFLINKNYRANINALNTEVGKLTQEKNCLDKRIDSLMINKEEELMINEERKKLEVESVKESFINQINKLTILNNKNNFIINTLEKEIEDLKEANRRQENNLRLLTGSHKELEKSINNNYLILHGEIEEKESKFNTLLRENEIKETHLKSLESLLKRKNQQIQEKSQTLFYEYEKQEEFDNENNLINNDNIEDTLKNNTNEFIYNPGKEEELNNLICLSKKGNFENKNEENKNEINNNENNINNNFVLFNDNNKDEFQSNSNQSFYQNKNNKIPGRIYSAKFK